MNNIIKPTIIDYNPNLKNISKKDILYRQVIHTVYKQSRYYDIVGIKEQIMLKDNETIWNYRIIKNPVRSFYVTKPNLRCTHRYKKEFEYIKNLDEIFCNHKALTNTIKNVLNLKTRSNYLDANILSNPYLYKADIDIESLIKINYLEDIEKKNISNLIPLEIGFLDIEIDLNSNIISSDKNDISIMSLTIGNKVYSTFLKHRMFEEDPKTKKIVPFTLDQLKQKSAEFYKEDIEKYNFEFFYYPANNIKEMILYIFNIIKKSHVDFIGIWNMNFDLPFIIRAAEQNNINKIDLLNNDYIPNEYKYLYYKEDKYKSSHPMLKWHFLFNVLETQFIDSMCLYPTLRKTNKFESSYKLDYILKKYVGKGKTLELNTEGHRYYANRRYMTYIIYNQFDTMGLMELELVNKDITNMYLGALSTPLKDFNKSTKLITNEHFYYYKKKGMIISSASSAQIVENHLIQRFYKKRFNITIPLEKVIPKTGGAVLRPERVNLVGVNPFIDKKINLPYNLQFIDKEEEKLSIKEYSKKIKKKNIKLLKENIKNNKDDLIDTFNKYKKYDTLNKPDKTLISMFISDADLSSAYPSATIVYNISRSTINKYIFLIELYKDTVLPLHQLATEEFFQLFIEHKQNSVKIMNKFFGLYNYTDLEKIKI